MIISTYIFSLVKEANMFGYTSEKSSYDLYQHAKHLDEKIPDKYAKEMNCIYDWIKTREFCSAMDHNTKESWLWLRTSVIHPPLKVIDKYVHETDKCIVLHQKELVHRHAVNPSCRLCNKELAKSILEKIKFSIIICKCDKLWCHTPCAEDYIMKFPQCNMCKQYFILSPCCSSIQSKYADLMKQY
jgi:hypothetical protein